MIIIKKMFIALSVVLGLYCMQSCGGSVENNPQAVAEAAVKCFENDDFVAMKSLLDPTDKESQAFVTEREDISRLGTGEHPELTFVEVREGAEAGYKRAVFKDNNGFEYIVSVKNKDGQWYLDRFDNF